MGHYLGGDVSPSSCIVRANASSSAFARCTRAWAHVGIAEVGTITEYERYRVTPDDAAQALESGTVGMARIIAVFGMLAEDACVDVSVVDR
jgi:hypothetical protein